MFGCTEVSEDTGNNDNYNDNYSDNTTNDNTDNNTNNDNYNDNYNDNNTNTSYTVYFYAGEVNWDEVYVYSWDDYNKNEAWPGERMSSDGNGWYSATVNYPKIIFNGGNGGPQTSDLKSQDGYFVPENSGSPISGTWYTSKPNVGNNPEPDYPDYPDDPEPDYPDDPYYPDEPEEISAPSYLTANATSESSISLSWYSVSGATYYAVYYGTSSSTYSAKCYDYYTGTSAQITNLSAGTKYYFWVIATDGTLISDFSNMAYATTEEEEPQYISAPEIQNIELTTNESGLRITWNSISTATGYNVYRASSKYSSYTLIASNISFNTYDDTTVDLETVGNSYFYQITAKNSTTESSKSQSKGTTVTKPQVAVTLNGANVKGNSGTNYYYYPHTATLTINGVTLTKTNNSSSLPRIITSNYKEISSGFFTYSTSYQRKYPGTYQTLYDKSQELNHDTGYYFKPLFKYKIDAETGNVTKGETTLVVE